jgi:hypothetical protein
MLGQFIEVSEAAVSSTPMVGPAPAPRSAWAAWAMKSARTMADRCDRSRNDHYVQAESGGENAWRRPGHREPCRGELDLFIAVGGDAAWATSIGEALGAPGSASTAWATRPARAHSSATASLRAAMSEPTTVMVGQSVATAWTFENRGTAARST